MRGKDLVDKFDLVCIRANYHDPQAGLGGIEMRTVPWAGVLPHGLADSLQVKVVEMVVRSSKRIPNSVVCTLILRSSGKSTGVDIFIEEV